MTGDVSAANWITSRLKEDSGFSIANNIGSGFIEIARTDGPSFTVAAIGIKDLIVRDHVRPLFEVERKPLFVVNVPSKAIWSGDAIAHIHSAPAAFGTLGDLVRASREEDVSMYRNKDIQFFDQAFHQHQAVREVTRVFDRVYRLHRYKGLPDVTVVLVNAYDMSAEDIRNARSQYGTFDAALKMTSYGSITSAAHDAAASIGARAFKFGEFMGRLNKP